MTTATVDQSRDGSIRQTEADPAVVAHVLLWPVVSLLITGAMHFTLEAIWPDLRTVFVPAVLAPLLLAYGAWVGSRTVLAGGGYLAAIVGAAVLGLLPIVLDVVGFGVILGRGVTAGWLAGVFGWSFIVFGALVGAGFMLGGRTQDRA